MATKLSIEEILRGVGEVDGMLRVRVDGRVAERLRVMGRVLGKFMNEERSYGNLVLDDETGTIRAKFFSRNIHAMEDIQLGDLVEIVGIVGKFQDEVHIVADMITVLSNVNWELLRKLEITVPSNDLEEKILEVLASEGEASTEKLKGKFGEDSALAIKKLLSRGDIYESSPDKYSAVK